MPSDKFIELSRITARRGILTLPQRWALVTRGCDWALPGFNAAPSRGSWCHRLSYLPLLVHGGGEGNGSFYLTWENSSGSVSALPQSMKNPAPGLYLGFTYTEFIALLNYRAAGSPGRTLWFVLSCVTPVVISMVSSGFPQDRRWQEEASSTTAKGELGQHPAHNMPQSQGGCRQVGYLGSVLGMVGNHGSGTVSLLIKEERLLAIHTIEINIATKLRLLVSKDRLCKSLSLVRQKTVKCLCLKYRNKSQRHPLAHEQASENSVNNSDRVCTVSSRQLPSCSLQLLRARMLACACSWHVTVSNRWCLKGRCHRFLHLIMVK